MSKQQSSTKASQPTRARWAITVVVCLLLLAGVVAVGGWLFAGPDTGEMMNQPTYEVVQQDLVISVTVSGTINARDLTKVKNEVRGRTNVIWLIPEGAQVEKDELLVELDSSEFRDQLVDQEIRVQNADAAFTRATEELAVTQNQAEADLAQAELDLQFAREDLHKYEEGEYPKQLKEAESKITLAHEELKQAQDKLEWSKRLFDQKFISESEYEADQLAAKRKQLDHELAQAELELLQDYTYKRELAQLESDVQQKRMAFDRAKRKARADVVQAEAELRAKESELQRQQSKLEDLKTQIEACRVTAPTPGMVVYATSGGNRWRQGEPLQEGAEVRERQELIHLPQSASMMASIQIHESALKKIRLGQPARITVDALPERVFSGSVGKIGLLPNQTQWWNPDLTVYDAEIYIDGDAKTLRTGMKCKVEILVDQYRDTLAVPVQAVQRVNGDPTVWVRDGEGFTPRKLEVGLDNNRMVHVLSGLEPGDIVDMTPPLQQAATQSEAMAVEGEETVSDGQTKSELRYQNVGTWSSDIVQQARNAAEENPSKQEQQLTEEDQQIIRILTLGREHGFLDQLKMSDQVRTQIDTVLEQVDNGQTVQIPDGVRAVVRDAMNKMRKRQGQGQAGESLGNAKTPHSSTHANSDAGEQG